jgi:hypothetical protein
VAGIIASDRKRSGVAFAAVTFFFLGPLGPGFAWFLRATKPKPAALEPMLILARGRWTTCSAQGAGRSLTTMIELLDLLGN